MYILTAAGNMEICKCNTREELNKYIGALRGFNINHYVKESFNGVSKTIGMYLDGKDYVFKG